MGGGEAAQPSVSWSVSIAAIAALELPRHQAEDWLCRPLLRECIDPESSERTPVVVVTDNGRAYRAAAFAR